MANLGMKFDSSTVEPNVFKPMPTAWYPIQIVDSEMKPVKDNDKNAYLNLTIEILDGEFKGRKVWDRLNLYNDNPVTKEIAHKQLSAICRATGVNVLEDSAQLHGIPMMARIFKKAASGDYDETNEVKSYKAMESTAGGAAPGAQQQPPSWAQSAVGHAADAPPAGSTPTGWQPPQAEKPAPSFPPEAIEWAKQNQNHPEAIKILASIQQPKVEAKPAWTPPTNSNSGGGGWQPPAQPSAPSDASPPAWARKA